MSIIILKNKKIIASILDITERKLAEQSLSKNIDLLSKLNKFSIELSNLSFEENLESFIAKSLKEISGATFAIFSEYLPMAKSMTTRHIELEPGLLEKVVGLLGKQITKVQSPVSDEMYNEMMTKTIGLRKTINEASFGAVSKPISKAIQSLLKVDRFIGLAYIIDGKLYGTSLVAMKKDQEDLPNDILENFLYLAAMALRRRKAEQELKEKMNDLQRFHNLTVDREINMIELKKEVNDLLKSNGQKEKYVIVG
jgi:hypothetical protein